MRGGEGGVWLSIEDEKTKKESGRGGSRTMRMKWSSTEQNADALSDESKEGATAATL